MLGHGFPMLSQSSSYRDRAGQHRLPLADPIGKPLSRYESRRWAVTGSAAESDGFEMHRQTGSDSAKGARGLSVSACHARYNNLGSLCTGLGHFRAVLPHAP